MIHHNQPVPVYPLEPDETTGSRQFRLYQYNGEQPNRSELLVPHRKDNYLFVFIRHAEGQQWIDMTPYPLKENTVYFVTPDELIVKDEIQNLWSTGIAFTREFLSQADNAALSNLPLIQNLHKGYELPLSPADILFVEDMLAKITTEHKQPGGEWQPRMLTALLTVLLTYLSRLYTEQYRNSDTLPDKQLLKRFVAKVNECYREQHEVGDYAALLHISAGHLSEVVKAQSGRSAIRHIHERILLEARRLLFHTSQSAKEIAFDLGFRDASYFNRFFKRETGNTPSGYRNQLREMYHEFR